jgi:hypothetical protein
VDHRRHHPAGVAVPHHRVGVPGLVGGVAALELLAWLVPDGDFFANPSVDFTVALIANAVLVTAGAVAASSGPGRGPGQPGDRDARRVTP